MCMYANTCITVQMWSCLDLHWVKDTPAHIYVFINISEECRCGVASSLSIFSEAEVNSIFWDFPRNCIS